MADPRGPMPRLLAPAWWLMARCYGAAVAWRNARFDRGGGVERFEAAPVISIGNMTAGGTGKSPFVAWSAAVLSDIGANAVITLRGYGATAAQESDEAREYARAAPAARVVVGARRREALCTAFAAGGADGWTASAAVLLDDGFQHRRLARDLDIVLVDATRPALDGDLLPNGWLREPARNIARADLVVITKAHDPAERARAAELVARVRGRPHDAACEHVWKSLEVHADGARRTEPVDWLRGRRVLSACALGNPRHFHGMVARTTGVAPAEFTRADHAAMDPRDLEAARSRAGAECVVTSRKDFVKFAAAIARTTVVPDLGISFLEGEQRVRDAIAACVSARVARSSA